MTQFWFSFFLCFTMVLLGDVPYPRFQYGRDACYQPLIVNGKIILDSDNSSGGNWIIFDRYQAIKTFLDRFDRPLKVLDIGANSGFFSLKIAEDYPGSHCVMIDGSSRLADICMANTERNNILYLQKYFNIHDLRELVQRERFDVILCLHVLHHVDHWNLWLPELKKMGCYLVAEIPPLNDGINTFSHTRALTSHILTYEKYEELGRFPRGRGGPEDYL
nr:methyltransferase domain-containing protein [Simkaniaceae bacterium]